MFPAVLAELSIIIYLEPLAAAFEVTLQSIPVEEVCDTIQFEEGRAAVVSNPSTIGRTPPFEVTLNAVVD